MRSAPSDTLEHDDDAFGRRLRPYLDDGCATLPAHVEQRLAQARAIALQRAHAPLPELALAGPGIGGWGPATRRAGLWKRGLAALVLTGAVLGGGQWLLTQQRHHDEVEQDVSTLMGDPDPAIAPWDR